MFDRAIERLEARRFLSATLENGLLTISGTDADDTFYVRIGTFARTAHPTDGQKRYFVSQSISGNGLQTFAYKKVKRIEIHCGAGNDLGNLYYIYDAGPDFFIQSVTVPTVIYGDSGDDSLSAMEGPTTLIGGDGDDTLYSDIFSTISNRMDGGAGDDSITGTGGNDTIFGRSGNDSISSGGGNDRVYGGDGDDTLLGGEGRDYLYAGAGADHLIGGDDRRDILLGGSGADTFDFFIDSQSEARDWNAVVDLQREL